MIKLDNKDKKILTILTKNARASVSEVSRKTGIPRDSVGYRVTRLKKLKVIDMYHTVLDPVILGYPIYSYVAFTLNSFDDEKKFYAYLSTQPNITYVAKVTGRWDCLITIVAQTLEQFDDVLRDIRAKFSGLIKDIETSSIIKQYKYDEMVDLIKER